MSWAVRAWRDSTGAAGITIGTVYPAGYDNHVAEFDLDEREFSVFVDRCVAAMQRARASATALHEPLPGAYDDWRGELTPVEHYGEDERRQAQRNAADYGVP